MTEFAMCRTCAECPWLLSSPPGRFPAQKYAELASTCRPGGLPKVFACHKTSEGTQRACAGFLLTHGDDNNRCRIARMQGRYDPADIEASGPLYASFTEMAEANGWTPTAPKRPAPARRQATVADLAAGRKAPARRGKS